MAQESPFPDEELPDHIPEDALSELVAMGEHWLALNPEAAENIWVLHHAAMRFAVLLAKTDREMRALGGEGVTQAEAQNLLDGFRETDAAWRAMKAQQAHGIVPGPTAKPKTNQTLRAAFHALLIALFFPPFGAVMMLMEIPWRRLSAADVTLAFLVPIYGWFKFWAW